MILMRQLRAELQEGSLVSFLRKKEIYEAANLYSISFINPLQSPNGYVPHKYVASVIYKI